MRNNEEYHFSGQITSLVCFFSSFNISLLVQFKPEEIAGIMKDFDEPGTLAPTGLFLGGTKYMVIQGEPGAVIRGKKVLNFVCFKVSVYLSR